MVKTKNKNTVVSAKDLADFCVKSFNTMFFNTMDKSIYVVYTLDGQDTFCAKISNLGAVLYLSEYNAKHDRGGLLVIDSNGVPEGEELEEWYNKTEKKIEGWLFKDKDELPF